MSTNTAMRLVTVPAARKIHPVGHTPPERPAECSPRAQRHALEAASSAPPSLDPDDSVILGIRIRNSPRFRRRRAVATVLATAALLLAWSLSSVLAHHLVPAAAGDPIPVAAAVHVVQPGDTLWSIATNVVGAPDEQVREVVDQLAARAGGSSLKIGQHVSLDGLTSG